MVLGSFFKWAISEALMVAVRNNPGGAGNQDEVAQALAELAARSPSLARDPATYFRFHRLDEAIIDRLVVGLRKAGWKEPDASTATGGQG